MPKNKLTILYGGPESDEKKNIGVSAHSWWTGLCRESLFCTVTTVLHVPLLLCFCRCLSSVSPLYLSLTWCHAESSTHCCFFLCSHSVRPQGVQTCHTFREYLMIRSLSGTPLSPVERDLRLQFAFEVDTKQFEHIVLCNVISCHYTRGFESEKVLKYRGGMDALDVWKYWQKGRDNGWHHCLEEDRCSGDI